MLYGKRVAVVLPAYNAARTVEKTVQEIPREIVDDVLLIDDSSNDETVQFARRLGLRVFVHEKNFGYGRNQKTCYAEALRTDADVIVMLHPDYQYEPRLVLPMAGLIATGVYDVVVASRILGGKARSGGMPLYKYAANRVLTLVQNFFVGAKLSEYQSLQKYLPFCSSWCSVYLCQGKQQRRSRLVLERKSVMRNAAWQWKP